VPRDRLPRRTRNRRRPAVSACAPALRPSRYEGGPDVNWIEAGHIDPLVARDTDSWRRLYRRGASVEREFGRLKHHWSLPPLRVRGLERVRLHADLTILARLACALARPRPCRSRRKPLLRRKTGPAGIPCASESVASARCSRFGGLCSLGAGVDGRRASSTSLLLSGRKSEGGVFSMKRAGCLGRRHVGQVLPSSWVGAALISPSPAAAGSGWWAVRSRGPIRKEGRQAARNSGRPAGAKGRLRVSTC
jgi:hypothetical protein